MSWHWIFRDFRLSGDEKLVALAIRSHQDGDVPTMVGSRVIAADCGRSVRQVNRCKSSLERFGVLVVKMVRTKRGPARLYQIVQKQADLFDSPKKPPGTVSPRISVKAKSNTNTKTAQNHARTNQTQENAKAKTEWERRQEAKNKRLAVERAVAAEAHVGLAPIPEDHGVHANPEARRRILERMGRAAD